MVMNDGSLMGLVAGAVFFAAMYFPFWIANRKERHAHA